MNNKHVFIDMDGTITTFTGPNTKVYLTEEELNTPGLFYNKLPLTSLMTELINYFDNSTLYILSASPSDHGIDEKNKWLDKYFPLPKENRYFVRYQQQDKVEKLIELITDLDIPKEDVILIDDDHKILFKAESLGIQVFHPSYFIAVHDFNQKTNTNNFI
jgi:FMN phosphatase YigB (HAD superfamily)